MKTQGGDNILDEHGIVEKETREKDEHKQRQRDRETEKQRDITETRTETETETKRQRDKQRHGQEVQTHLDQGALGTDIVDYRLSCIALDTSSCKAASYDGWVERK